MKITYAKIKGIADPREARNLCKVNAVKVFVNLGLNENF